MLNLVRIGLFSAAAFLATTASAQDIHVRDRCPDQGASDYYFPEDSLDSDASSDQFRREWYSKHLRAMRATSLSCGDSGQRYRFTWLRTFDHSISIEVVVNMGDSSVTFVELDGAGGYEPGSEFSRYSPLMEPKKLLDLRDILTAADFWSWPTTVRGNGLDGAEWIVEGRKGKSYRVHAAWSPKDGPIRAFAMELLSFVGWEFHTENIY